MEVLYSTKVTCMQCGHGFQTSRVRPSFKKASRTDTDFCTYFIEANPDYYVVRVCPSCGFASTENFSEQFNEEQKKTFRQSVSERWSKRDYGGERSLDDALQTYKLALLCAQIKAEKERVIAGLLHHIAWLYRYKEDKEQEKRFLQYALEVYISVYELEEAALNNARLMYLIGELHRRLGQYIEAVKWFSRVINDKSIMDAAMIRACKEQWMATREDMIAANMDLPEEMRQSAN